jgi:hypothetical protein
MPPKEGVHFKFLASFVEEEDLAGLPANPGPKSQRHFAKRTEN